MNLYTVGGIKDTIKMFYPTVKEVRVKEHMGQFKVTITVILYKYSWFYLGIMHYIIKKKIEKLVHDHGAYYYEYKIKVR